MPSGLRTVYEKPPSHPSGGGGVLAVAGGVYGARSGGRAGVCACGICGFAGSSGGCRSVRRSRQRSSKSRWFPSTVANMSAPPNITAQVQAFSLCLCGSTNRYSRCHNLQPLTQDVFARLVIDIDHSAIISCYLLCLLKKHQFVHQLN